MGSISGAEGTHISTFCVVPFNIYVCIIACLLSDSDYPITRYFPCMFMRDTQRNTGCINFNCQTSSDCFQINSLVSPTLKKMKT